MRLFSRIGPYRWGYSVVGFGFVVCFLEEEGDGRSGTLGQGREASLRLPHVSLS